MSQHRSLKSASRDKGIRSVLKRFEKIKTLLEKGKWKEGDSVFGLPKVKVMRLKLKKKIKEAPEELEEGKVAETEEGAPESESEEKKQPKEEKIEEKKKE